VGATLREKILAARRASLNGGSKHALFSFFLEGYSQENAKRIGCFLSIVSIK
jgi:hypothetical protein